MTRPTKEEIEQLHQENCKAGIDYHQQLLIKLYDQAVERGMRDADFFIRMLAIMAQNDGEHHFQIHRLQDEIKRLHRQIRELQAGRD